MVCTYNFNIVFVSILITCVNIKEKSTVNVESVSVKQMFKALVQNDQAVAVVVTIVLINASVYITSNLVIYFLNMTLVVPIGIMDIHFLTHSAVRFRFCQ